MINKVEILSPVPGCRRTQKIIRFLKEFFKENNIEAEFMIISDISEFIKYRTWLLPTILINDKIIARGYRPSINKILENLND